MLDALVGQAQRDRGITQPANVKRLALADVPLGVGFSARDRRKLTGKAELPVFRILAHAVAGCMRNHSTVRWVLRRLNR